MLDSVTLERAGIPTVTVVTGIFEVPARAQARQVGMPDLAIVVIPDKVGWQNTDELEDIARALLEPVIGGLTATTE